MSFPNTNPPVESVAQLKIDGKDDLFL